MVIIPDFMHMVQCQLQQLSCGVQVGDSSRSISWESLCLLRQALRYIYRFLISPHPGGVKSYLWLWKLKTQKFTDNNNIICAFITLIVCYKVQVEYLSTNLRYLLEYFHFLLHCIPEWNVVFFTSLHLIYIYSCL